MENNNPEKKGAKLMMLISRYGTYALVILCIIGVAVASVFMLPKSDEEKRDARISGTAYGDASESDTAGAVAKTGDKSLNDMIDPYTGKVVGEAKQPRLGDARPVKNTPAPDFTPAPKSDGKITNELLPAPVDGEITWGYAIDELIYSSTLDQWTTHAGVDIACKQGDSIRAVADGTVEKVYTDDAFGITVVIKHKNGHRSVYSNLAQSDELVREGNSVKANSVIGVCGNTAKFECSDKSHLHFEYHVDGKPVDPSKYVRIKGYNK